jgi:plasmid stabilization system protein ParE
MGKRAGMKLVWTRLARRQSQKIADYYTEVAGAKTAKKIVREINESAKILAKNPYVAQRELLLEGRSREYRRLIVGNFKVVYYTEGDTVYISTVFDCRRDPALLRESVVEAEA